MLTGEGSSRSISARQILRGVRSVVEGRRVTGQTAITFSSTTTGPDTPGVSVVVIVLNGAATIGPCLEALARQNFPRDCYEVVVVDNGSNDGSVELASQYPVKIVHQRKRGYAPARNAGIKAASGDIVAF